MVNDTWIRNMSPWASVDKPPRHLNLAIHHNHHRMVGGVAPTAIANEMNGNDATSGRCQIKFHLAQVPDHSWNGPVVNLKMRLLREATLENRYHLSESGP